MILPASISVVMPVHNGAAPLDRAIRSIVSQTYPEWELLAVNDCSSDESYALRAHLWCRGDLVTFETDLRGSVKTCKSVAVNDQATILSSDRE